MNRYLCNSIRYEVEVLNELKFMKIKSGLVGVLFDLAIRFTPDYLALFLCFDLAFD